MPLPQKLQGLSCGHLGHIPSRAGAGDAWEEGPALSVSLGPQALRKSRKMKGPVA